MTDNNIVEVPDLYFDAKFSLVTPSSFEQSINPKDRDSEAQLTRLNLYLDHVEHSLLNQIWIRSDAIFGALDDIKGQKFHVSQALMRLINLRTQLKVLDKRIAVSAIHIPQMQRRLGNESVLHEKVVSMQRVVQALSGIRALIEVADFLGAFELISESKRLHSSELQDIKAMATAGKQLEVYDALVCEVISNKFVSIAIAWEESDGGGARAMGDEGTQSVMNNAAVGAAATAATTTRSSSSNGKTDDGAGMDSDVTNAAELRKLTHALLQIDRLPPAFGMYKSRLMSSLRQIVRTCVTEYVFCSSVLPLFLSLCLSLSLSLIHLLLSACIL